MSSSNIAFLNFYVKVLESAKMEHQSDRRPANKSLVNLIAIYDLGSDVALALAGLSPVNSVTQ